MYKIKRSFMNGKTRTLETGVSLEVAKAHCDDPETSYKTCKESAGLARTRKCGAWFDYFTEIK